LDDLKQQLRDRAAELGFGLFGVTSAVRAPHADAFQAWLEAGYHADMGWMTRNPERRSDPTLVLPGAQSVVMLGMDYYQGAPARHQAGRIARYAWGQDYHDRIEDQLKELAALLEQAGGTQKCYVDTGPMLERDFASEAGLGWQGKSTMLIHPKRGTWFFLACIITTLPLALDSAEPDHCGRCRRCIDACPTGAILEGRRLDANRCISWLTIENKGVIPLEFRRAIGDRLYGCDECLDVCPWNRFAQESQEATFTMPDWLRRLPARDFLSWDDATFRDKFRGSPIKRIKRHRFLRNVCVVLGNVGTVDDLPALEQAVRTEEPMVAEHAEWAIAEIESRHGNDSRTF